MGSPRDNAPMSDAAPFLPHTNIQPTATALLLRLRAAFEQATAALAQACARHGQLDAALLDQHQVASYELAWVCADLLAADTQLSTLGAQSTDDAEGRYPDGAESVVALTLPTPAGPNLHAWLLPVGTDQLRLTTTPGWRYQVETSLDLHTWLPWTPPSTAGGATLDIPATHPEPRRYFRAAVGDRP